jgi:undecaprenyl-diphosphatase
MTYLQAAVLALVQGVTEFLPISSSAHLILVPYLADWPDQGLAFDIATNTGSLVAVILYFRRDLMEILKAGFASLPELVSAEARRRWSPEKRLAWAVALGTVPVAVVGLLAADFIEDELRSPVVIATTSIVFGLLLWWADRAGSRGRDLERLGVWDTIVVGVSQALALIPGTSRSGVTMTAGMARGLDREAAARFSFLLAVPVGILVALHDLVKIVGGEVPAEDLGPMLLGFVLAGVSAYVVIGWLLSWLKRQSMTVFVVYRVVLGLVLFALVFAGR